jgi:hypothetical protein
LERKEHRLVGFQGPEPFLAHLQQVLR